MGEQAYSGTCPASDPGGLRIDLLLSHPRGEVAYPPTMRVGCPRESELGEALFGGELCPDGGMHELAAISAEEYAAGDEGEVTSGQPPAVGWAQSPSDGLWHAVQLTTAPDVEGDDVTAACGHRIPGAAAAHAEQGPQYPTCLPCSVAVVGRIGSGRSI